MAKAYNDPSKFAEALIAQNPNLKPYMQQAIDYVQQNGGDSKAAFNKLMQGNGVDLNEISKLIQR